MQTEQRVRRSATVKKLFEGWSVRVPPDLLPVIAHQGQPIRSREQIVDRCFALLVVMMKAFDDDPSEYAHLLNEVNLSPVETEYVFDTKRSASPKLTWRCNALWTLMWCVNLVSKPSEIDSHCSVDDLHDVFEEVDCYRVASIRPAAEIFDMHDFVYNAHWAARTYGESCSIDGRLVRQQHLALNWVISYGNKDWDLVSTDT